MSDDAQFSIRVKPDQKDADKILKKLSAAADESDIKKKEYPGRTKCDTLRAIRRKIAEANGIEYQSEECGYHGPCLGTCPVCDEEIRFLNEELAKKKAQGEEIIITGLGLDEIRGFAGRPEAENDLDSKDEGEDNISCGMDVPWIGVFLDLDESNGNDNTGLSKTLRKSNGVESGLGYINMPFCDEKIDDDSLPFN